MTAALAIAATVPNGGSRTGNEPSGTPVETWAPAFAWLDRWTVETTQEPYRGRVVCRLCERPIRWTPRDRARHLRDHLRELAAWRAKTRRAREREAAARLRLVTRLRREGR